MDDSQVEIEVRQGLRDFLTADEAEKLGRAVFEAVASNQGTVAMVGFFDHRRRICVYGPHGEQNFFMVPSGKLPLLTFYEIIRVRERGARDGDFPA